MLNVGLLGDTTGRRDPKILYGDAAARHFSTRAFLGGFIYTSGCEGKDLVTPGIVSFQLG